MPDSITPPCLPLTDAHAHPPPPRLSARVVCVMGDPRLTHHARIHTQDIDEDELAALQADAGDTERERVRERERKRLVQVMYTRTHTGERGGVDLISRVVRGIRSGWDAVSKGWV